MAHWLPPARPPDLNPHPHQGAPRARCHHRSPVRAACAPAGPALSPCPAAGSWLGRSSKGRPRQAGRAALQPTASPEGPLTAREAHSLTLISLRFFRANRKGFLNSVLRCLFFVTEPTKTWHRSLIPHAKRMYLLLPYLPRLILSWAGEGWVAGSSRDLGLRGCLAGAWGTVDAQTGPGAPWTPGRGLGFHGCPDWTGPGALWTPGQGLGCRGRPAWMGPGAPWTPSRDLGCRGRPAWKGPGAPWTPGRDLGHRGHPARTGCC